MAKILKRDLSKEAFCENRGKYSFGEIETKSEISNSLTIYSIVTETIKGILSGEYDSSEASDIIDTAGQLSTLPAEDEANQSQCKKNGKNILHTDTWRKAGIGDYFASYSNTSVQWG